MTKRILAILLALAMIFSLWCVEIVAADEEYKIGVILISESNSVGGASFSKSTGFGYVTPAITKSSSNWDLFVKAVNVEGARFVLKYDVSGSATSGYVNFFIVTNASNAYPATGTAGIASYGDVSKFNDTYNGTPNTEGKLLWGGSHVVTYACSDFLALLGGKTFEDDDCAKVGFQFDRGDSDLEIEITDLYIEIPADTEGEWEEAFTPILPETPDGYEIEWSWSPSVKVKTSGWTTAGSLGFTDFNGLVAALKQPGARLEVVTDGTYGGWFGLEISSGIQSVGENAYGTVASTKRVFDGTRHSFIIEGESLEALLNAIGDESVTGIYYSDGANNDTFMGFIVYKHVDHSAEEWTTDEDNHWKICETCGVKFGEDAHDEKGTVGEAIDATCTEKGKTAGVKCSVCDTVIEEPKDTDVLGHDWATEWSKDTNGHYKACLNGCSEKNEEAEHTFESTDDGEVCSECGYVDHEHVFTEVEYDKDGHWNKCTQCDTIDEDSKEEHTLTYTSDGEDEHTAECDVCDYTFTEAHTWDDGEVTAEPTETEDGETTYTCEVCGETKTEEIPATGSEDDDTDGDSEDDDAEDDNTGDSTDGVAYDSAPVALYNNAGYTSFQDYTEIDQAALVAALNTPGAILTITFEVTDPTGGGWLKLVPNGSDWSDAQCFTAGTAESQGKGPFTATFTNLNLTGQAFQYFNNNSKSNTVITRIVVTVPTTSTEPEPPTGTAPVVHHHAYVWLGDATGHRAFCHTCRTFLLQVSAHVYVNGTCALCGYKDPNAVSGGNTSGATKAAVEIEGLNIDSGAFNAVVYDGNLPAEFFEAIQIEGSVVNIKTTIPSGSADWSKIGFQETKSGSWPYTDGISATITADEDGNLVFSVNGPELYAQLDGGTFVEGSVQLYLNVTNSDGAKSTGKPYTTTVVVNVPAGDDTIEVEMPQEAAVAKTADETVAD